MVLELSCGFISTTTLQKYYDNIEFKSKSYYFKANLCQHYILCIEKTKNM